MKKILLLALVIIPAAIVSAQNTDWKKKVLDRPADHFMIQLTSDHWSGAPDSISSRIVGKSRGLAIALMLNKPFKTDPHWAVAFGVAISNSSMFFNKTSIGLSSKNTILPFNNLDSSDHFKKYKLATTFLEIPVELRYSLHPESEKNNWKIAVGLKVGTMLNAHTKGKTFQDKNNNTIKAYTLKESSKSFFNGTRVVATARIGIGSFSLVGTYQLTSFLKDGAGASIKPYQIGLCISGL